MQIPLKFHGSKKWSIATNQENREKKLNKTKTKILTFIRMYSEIRVKFNYKTMAGVLVHAFISIEMCTLISFRVCDR